VRELICKLEVWISVLAGRCRKFFNNLEEVKKVIHADMRGSDALYGSMKNMGFDCINLSSCKSRGGGHKRETSKLMALSLT
jgi:hypothetical protein